jgi:lysophospholipase L1-like esterase
VIDQPRYSARAKWVALAIFAIAGALVALAAAEGLTRLRQWSKIGTASSFESLYKVDERIQLRVLVPGARVGNITVNSLGFRGPEIPAAKPKGRIRLAFLGASTTFCAEVSGDSAVWPHVVVESLRARFPDVDFDYVNGGVPGYTVQSLRANLRHRIDALDPDIVVIYEATNDLSQEARQLAQAQGLARAGSIEPSWLARRFLLWELVEKNLRVMVANRGAESSSGRVVLDEAQLGSRFRNDLTELVEAAGRGERRVAVATFSTRLRPEQSPDEKKRSAVSALVYMPAMSLDGLLLGYGRYNEIIREVARDRQALLIGGENEIPGDAAHFADSVHFTDAGSRRMAQRVFDALVNDPKTVELIASRKARPG